MTMRLSMNRIERRMRALFDNDIDSVDDLVDRLASEYATMRAALSAVTVTGDPTGVVRELLRAVDAYLDDLAPDEDTDVYMRLIADRARFVIEDEAGE